MYYTRVGPVISKQVWWNLVFFIFTTGDVLMGREHYDLSNWNGIYKLHFLKEVSPKKSTTL